MSSTTDSPKGRILMVDDRPQYGYVGYVKRELEKRGYSVSDSVICLLNEHLTDGKYDLATFTLPALTEDVIEPCQLLMESIKKVSSNLLALTYYSMEEIKILESSRDIQGIKNLAEIVSIWMEKPKTTADLIEDRIRKSKQSNPK